jgi:hypothetical protein
MPLSTGGEAHLDRSGLIAIFFRQVLQEFDLLHWHDFLVGGLRCCTGPGRPAPPSRACRQEMFHPHENLSQRKARQSHLAPTTSITCSGSVQTCQTRSSGASKRQVTAGSQLFCIRRGVGHICSPVIYFKTQYPAACCAWVRRRRFTCGLT